jgi:hypothetical protein
MKLAVKRLRQSDLSFFEPIYRRPSNASKQKALNLNRSILVGQLYPDLEERGHEKALPIRLHIWGPDAAGELTLSRSIIKEQKNWRLNGELVREPEDGRFSSLEPDDVAVIRFDGVGMPETATLVIVSAAAPADASIHPALRELAGDSMSAVSPEDLLAAITDAPTGHPVTLLVPGEDELADLEEAAAGDPAAAARLTHRPNVSRAALSAARERAGDIGYEGECLIARWLGERQRSGDVRSWNWMARQNAASPFDFELVETDGTQVRVEVKTTVSSQPRPFYISLAEVTTASGDGRHDIYRLRNLSDEGAELRQSQGIGGWARNLLTACQAMPAGVTPQNFLVDEDVFDWSAPVGLTAPDEDEEEA